MEFNETLKITAKIKSLNVPPKAPVLKAWSQDGVTGR